MRVSDKWLKELINVEDDVTSIANKMLFAGNEYDSINELHKKEIFAIITLVY